MEKQDITARKKEYISFDRKEGKTMKQYSIEDLQDMIAEQKDIADFYTDLLEDFTCPAADCSECFSECGHEIFTDEIQTAEYKIEKYESMIENIQEGQKDMENNRKELTGFYNDYYQMYINADPETRQKTKQYNLDKHTENIISGRHDLIMFTAGKLIAIFKAEYDLATEGYQEGITNND